MKGMHFNSEIAQRELSDLGRELPLQFLISPALFPQSLPPQ